MIEKKKKKDKTMMEQLLPSIVSCKLEACSNAQIRRNEVQGSACPTPRRYVISLRTSFCSCPTMESMHPDEVKPGGWTGGTRGQTNTKAKISSRANSTNSHLETRLLDALWWGRRYWQDFRDTWGIWSKSKRTMWNNNFTWLFLEWNGSGINFFNRI